MLLSRIRLIHQRSYGTYGAPRIHAELRESGIRVGLKRVALLMRLALSAGCRAAEPYAPHGDRSPMRKHPIWCRDFTAKAVDTLWVADITYVPTYAGFLYLSVVIDAFSRRVALWSMGNYLRTS